MLQVFAQASLKKSGILKVVHNQQRVNREIYEVYSNFNFGFNCNCSFLIPTHSKAVHFRLMIETDSRIQNMYQVRQASMEIAKIGSYELVNL